MGGWSISFGDPEQYKKFFEEYRPFLLENRLILEATKAIMLERVIHPTLAQEVSAIADLPDEDPRVRELEDKYHADLACFILARTAVDDYSEILTLASNGFGVGALKLLRGMYERVVTSAYVSLYPEVSRALVDDAWIQYWKIWKRAVGLNPNLANAIAQNDIDNLKTKADEARVRYRESFCKECNQLIQMSAWTKVDLNTMAQKVDSRLTELGLPHSSLSGLYLMCYLEPTVTEHATGASINDKFALVDGLWTYKMDTSKERRHGVVFGHLLLLLMLQRQDQHFGYGLEEVLRPRFEAYEAVWSVGTNGKEAL